MLVNIDVDDLGKAIDFYEQALGLSLLRRLFNSSVAEMSGATSQIFLIEQPAASNPTKEPGTQRSYARHWTPVHIDFEVDDVIVARERAIAAGAKPEGQVSDAKWGRLARMSDPFGHGFCLIEFSEQGYGAAE